MLKLVQVLGGDTAEQAEYLVAPFRTGSDLESHAWNYGRRGATAKLVMILGMRAK